MTEQKGFIAGLLDFSFNNLIATRVIKVLYGLFLGAVCLGGLIIPIAALLSGEILAFMLAIVVAPVAVLFYVILGRMYFEFVVVVFKGVEHLEVIRQNTEK